MQVPGISQGLLQKQRVILPSELSIQPHDQLRWIYLSLFIKIHLWHDQSRDLNQGITHIPLLSLQREYRLLTQSIFIDSRLQFLKLVFTVCFPERLDCIFELWKKKTTLLPWVLFFIVLSQWQGKKLRHLWSSIRWPLRYIDEVLFGYEDSCTENSN